MATDYYSQQFDVIPAIPNGVADIQAGMDCCRQY